MSNSWWFCNLFSLYFHVGARGRHVAADMAWFFQLHLTYQMVVPEQRYTAFEQVSFRFQGAQFWFQSYKV